MISSSFSCWLRVTVVCRNGILVGVVVAVKVLFVDLFRGQVLARSRLLGEVVNTTLLFVFREAEADDADADPADDDNNDDVFGRIGVKKDISCRGL